jgi:hypothetical protein
MPDRVAYRPLKDVAWHVNLPGEERIIIVVEPERAITYPAQADKK